MNERKQKTASERAAAIAAWRASGQSAQAWAKGAGIPQSTFWQWRRAESQGSASRVGFVRLRSPEPVAGAERDGARLAVDVTSGEVTVEVGDARVRAARGTAWADVARAVALLRRAP